MNAVALEQTRENAVADREAIAHAEVGEIAASLWTQAVSACLGKLGAGDPERAMERLQGGGDTACMYLRHELACRVVESMAAIDESIRAAYVLDEMDTAEDAWNEGAGRASAIQMIIWVQPKTAALSSLVDALDAALLPKYAALMGTGAMARLLHVHLVDDAAVRDRVGPGLLLSAIHSRPLRIWERSA